MDVEPRNSVDSLTETAGAIHAVYTELSCHSLSASASVVGCMQAPLLTLADMIKARTLLSQFLDWIDNPPVSPMLVCPNLLPTPRVQKRGNRDWRMKWSNRV